MRATGARVWSLTAAGILLAGSTGLAGAQARPAAAPVAEGARKIVQGVQESAKGIGPDPDGGGQGGGAAREGRKRGGQTRR
jgi:hypothetical protein